MNRLDSASIEKPRHGMCQLGGKLELHSASQPVIDSQNCKKCGICIKHCAHEAIHFDAQHIAEIDYSRCVGVVNAWHFVNTMPP